jgi:predicted HAD superfamily phosphohydrolase YqeG
MLSTWIVELKLNEINCIVANNNNDSLKEQEKKSLNIEY